jgi:hypothetical protein
MVKSSYRHTQAISEERKRNALETAILAMPMDRPAMRHSLVHPLHGATLMVRPSAHLARHAVNAHHAREQR